MRPPLSETNYVLFLIRYKGIRVKGKGKRGKLELKIKENLKAKDLKPYKNT